jgi:hypothetical protein
MSLATSAAISDWTWSRSTAPAVALGLLGVMVKLRHSLASAAPPN